LESVAKMDSNGLMGKRILVVIVATVMLSGLLVLTRPEPEAQLRSENITRVEVVTVQRHSFSPTQVISGRLYPAHSAMLKAEVGGRLMARHVQPGQVVASGDVLLLLDSADYSDRYREAEARLSQERAGIERDRHLLTLASRNVALQREEVARQDKLGQTSLASASQAGQARQQLLQLESEQALLQYQIDTSDARITLREAEYQRAARALDRTRVQAPLAATVNRVLVDVGDFIGVGSQVLELVSAQELDVHIEVPGSIVRHLALDAIIPLTINGRSYSGTLLSLRIDPDPSTRTHAIRIRVSGEDLVPGMVASVEIPLARLSEVLTVPVSAILQETGSSHLFVLSDGRLQQRAVALGDRVGEQRVVTHGLDQGEQVVVRDVAALSSGQSVEVVSR
jgi:RND family efflux transporter MFP subunit